MNSIQSTGMLVYVTALAIVGAPTPTFAERSSENAALQYWLAFESMPRRARTDDRVWQATVYDTPHGFSVPVAQDLARFVDDEAEPCLTHLHRGARLSHCEWGTDLRKDGPNVVAPYGAKARRLARLSLLRARLHFERGEWDAGIDDVIATMVMGRHIGWDKLWYNIHYGCMIENMCVSTAAVYLPGMPEEARQQLSTRLASLPRFTPMREVFLHYENAIDWAVVSFKQAEKQGRLFALIESLSSRDEAKKILKLASDAHHLTRLAQEGRALLRKGAESMSLAPSEYAQLIEQQFQPRLKENPVAVLLSPPYDLARREEAAAHCRLVMLQAALDFLDRGRAALADHADPYGDGPFEFVAFDGGFELRSSLMYGDLRIVQEFGLRSD